MTAVDVSAVLALDEYRTGARVIEALEAQTIADRTELVLVGPSLEVPSAVGGRFAALVVVDAPIQPLSAARAAGIRAARGRAVYIAETHGFPRPDCLQSLLAEIDQGSGASMSRLVNANPGTARSWASLFATYGSFTGARPRRVPAVPLHNAAFDRRSLSPVASSAEQLVYGVGLSRALRRQGLGLSFCPSAVVDHLNVVSPRGIVVDRLIGGRLWAGLRSRAWSRGRRLAHAVGVPLSPLVMTARILRSDGWRESGSILPRGTGALVFAYAVVQALGELAGYVSGPGSAERQHLEIELHREAFL